MKNTILNYEYIKEFITTNDGLMEQVINISVMD